MNVRELVIARGISRKDTKWKNTKCNWDILCQKLAETTRTRETMQEYLSLAKSKQDEVKDIGGFVGGELKEGKRRKGYVNYRDLLTLDLDSVNVPSSELLFNLEIKLDFAYLVYSTHKHKTQSPRVRLVIPLSRSCKVDEYEAVGRYVASLIDIDWFDDTTFQAERLMYWPSTSSDTEYLYTVGPSETWLDVDDVLKNKYHDWTDITSWCYSSRVSAESIRVTADKQEDPTNKPGLIGCFCRNYTISDVINNWLSDIYIPTDINGRYSYALGSTSGGAVVYNDLFLYSHHSTDPVSMKLVNAYDLLRVHKFGELDKEAKEDTPVNKLPSFKAMNEFISEIPEIKEAMVVENINSKKSMSIDEFDKVESTDDSWVTQLTIANKNTGELKSCIDNFYQIMEHDPNLKELGRKNLFRNRFEVNKAPWKRGSSIFWDDADDSCLRHYIEVTYGIEGSNKIQDAFNKYCNNHNYHPIKEYLEKLEWDGTPRADTLLIDYLGATNSVYTKEVTRKTLLAAVKRLYEPGCKFDQMLVLTGDQGIGKSMLWKKLGMQWFSDTLSDIRGKESFEALEGVWIMECGELAGLRKADRDTLKNFISKQVDTYRKAYARNTTDTPRTCIFIGTTNEKDFLNDPTGARRFWPVDCKTSYEAKDKPGELNVWSSFTQAVVDQVWAEVMFIYNNTNEADSIMELSHEARKDWVNEADSHQLVSENLGIIEKYLDIDLPANWDLKNPGQRKDYIQSVMNEDTELIEVGVEGNKRKIISIIEIKKELGNLLVGNHGSNDFVLSREIADLMNNNKEWSRGTTARTPYGTQKCWKRITK